MDKELIVYEKLWNQVLWVENFVSNIILFDSILIEDEYNQRRSLEMLWEKQKYDFSLDKENIEKNRIYMSNKLYWLYFTYRAILLRVHYLYYKWKDQWQIVKFTNDKWINQYLKAVLTEKETEQILSVQFWSLSIIKNILQNKILEEINILKIKNKEIHTWWDIIIWNNNKNNINSAEFIQPKSRQNNVWLYIIIWVTIAVISGIIIYFII